MIGCILTGHGEFAVGVANALAMIAGEPEHFIVMPFGEQEDVNAFEERMIHHVSELKRVCEGVLIFTDLLGGSPFKAAMIAAQEEENVEVLAGTNLPMLIEIIGMRSYVADVTQLTNQAVMTGKDSVIHAQLLSFEEKHEEEEGI